MKCVYLLACAGLAVAQSWSPQTSETTASLRGVSALNTNIVWASGSKGTYVHTADGGATWKAFSLPGASDVDFRAVCAIDESIVFLLSIGKGANSRIYRTTDGGERWSVIYTNANPKGFFDGLRFWDPSHGILLGDPVDGHFEVLTTDDGGDTWKRRKTPGATAKEGAFAASNSSLVVRGSREVWFGTGGEGGARVFHSTDGGDTWSVVKTSIRNDGESAGIFSLAFSDGRHGIAVGGDYNKPNETAGTVAITSDGGKSWTAGGAASGFRSAVVYLADRKMWIATGTSGSDVSLDDGKSWKQFDAGNYNALGFAAGAGWAVGPKGAIAKFK